jgi:hypothetical protein
MKKLAVLLLVTSSVAFADDAAQKYVKEKSQLLERGFRDDDWAGMIEIGHDVLMRLPGEPTTLKWTGLALAQVGARRLALRALEESLRQKPDAEGKKALEQLRQSFTQVRVEISDVPNDPAVVDALMQLGTPLLPKGPERIAMPGLSDADKKKLAERVKNIETLGGIPPAKPTVERGASSLAVVYKDVEITAPTVKLHASLEKQGYEDVDLELTLKPGDKTVSKVQLHPLASLVVTGAGASDSLTLDGKPINAAGARVKPGSHVLARVRGGVSWPTEITVAVGEKKTVALDEPWPEIVLEGWKPGDQVTVGGKPATLSAGKIFTPPGEVQVVWKRGSLPGNTFTATPPAKLTLPGIVHVMGDDPGLSVELSGPAGPTRLGNNAVVQVQPGTYAMTARVPRREPVTRTINVAPGEDVTLDLSSGGFRPTAEYARTEGDTRKSRKIGLALVGVGAGLAGLAGASAGLWGWQRAVGDDAYAAYMASNNLGDLELNRSNVTDATTQQWVWGSAAIALGVGGVACLGVGIWELTKRRPR